MAVFIDIKSRFDDTSGRKAAEEAKRYFANAGTSAGNDFSSNFAKAVERDDKVRAAADKVADKLDKITAAEAKRATQLEKSKAVNEAVAASETKLNAARDSGDVDAIAAGERELTSLREKQTEINNRLIVSSTAVSRAERDRARAVRDASQAYRDMGSDVDSLGTKIANLGSVGGALKLNLGLAALGTLPAAATAITEVAGALQQLAGAGFAIPGIFAGIASSVGVGALGMYGMADAIKAVDKASDGTKSSVEAANKALNGLAPAQADVVKTVVGLKGSFDDLRAIGSGNMFAGVSNGIKGLAAADLPAITRGVDGISRGINQNLMQAINSLGSSSSQGFLDRIFGNTSSAQSKLTGAIDPIVHAVGLLSAAGSDSLPRLADAVGKVADRFDKFISAADGDGRLKKWIDEGIDGFTNVGNAALNIGKSFTALTQAAGGGAGLLGTLESATGKMATFLNSTEGQNKLQTFFAEGRDMLGQLKDVASSAGPVLAGLFQSGISAANLWLPVIKQALDTINKIPGGAEAVVSAFVAWRSITGVASLIASLQKVKDLLGIGIPNAAAATGGKLSSALALTGPLAAATALTAAYDGILHKLDQVTHTNIPSTLGQIPGSGAFIYDRVIGDKPWLPQQNATGTANPNQQVIPGPNGAASVVTAPSGTPYDPFAVVGVPRPASRGVGGVARPGAPWNSTPSVGASSYSAPVITDGSGAPGGGAPYIDPSKYMAGDPLAGLPGAVAGADPTKIREADSQVITATHNLEQGRLALQVLEAKGNATQQELLTAKNNLQEQERALYDAQAKDIAARTNQMKQATTDLASVFAPLDQDFGVSKGLPGIVENLVKALGNFALGGAIRSDPGLQAGAAQLAANGGVAPGLFNQQYFTGSSASGAPAGYATGSAGYAGDAALLANVPAGRYSQDPSRDLLKGLSDCSSSVGDLVNIMDGQQTGSGGNLTTGNAATWLPQHGFVRGEGAPGDFRVGYNGGHMQATLPGGTPWNWGSDAAAARRGIGGTGADDSAFTDHWYRPAGGSGGLAAPASAGLASGGGGTQSVFVVNMPGGGLFGGGGPASPSAIGPTPLGGGTGTDLFPPVSTGVGTGPAPGPTGWGVPGIPSGITGGGGQGPVFGANTPGMVGAGVPPAGFNTGVQPSGGGGGTGGVGLGGDLIGAASMAADIMAPGSSIGIKLANRAIQFAGQAAAIGVSGAVETWLPAGSPLAANSWFSKLAGGFAGAKPASPNKAGGPGGGQPGQQPPMGSPAPGQGAGPQPGPGNGVTVNYTNNQATEDRAGADLTTHLGAMYSGPGR